MTVHFCRLQLLYIAGYDSECSMGMCTASRRLHIFFYFKLFAFSAIDELKNLDQGSTSGL